MLVDREDTVGAQNAVHGLDAGDLVRNLAEDGHEDSEIEVTFRERKIGACVTLRVSNVLKSLRLEFPLRLGKHLRLYVEQLKPAALESTRKLATEVPGARSDLEDARAMDDWQTICELLGSHEQSSYGIVEEPRELMRKATAAEGPAQSVSA